MGRKVSPYVWLAFLLIYLSGCAQLQQAAEELKAKFKGKLASIARTGLNEGTLYAIATSPQGRVFRSKIASDRTYSLEVTAKSQYVITFARDTNNDDVLDTLEAECMATDEAGSTVLIGAPSGEIDLGDATLPTNGNIFVTAAVDLRTLDTDGDGKTDFVDTDADANDVLDTKDQTELCGTDDLIPALLDWDDDNDGILDAADSDDDGDGVVDASEPDDDKDGIPNSSDKQSFSISIEVGSYSFFVSGVIQIDTDRDGVPDVSDADDDNDKVLDADDLDDNNDKVLDTAEPDKDGDLVANYLDTDDDGDGTLDQVDTDDNNDGIADVDQDTDKDGIPDFADSDKDGDGILNGAET